MFFFGGYWLPHLLEIGEGAVLDLFIGGTLDDKSPSATAQARPLLATRIPATDASEAVRVRKRRVLSGCL